MAGLETGVAMARTLMFSDLVGSTSLVQRLGDERWAELSARHDRIARDVMSAHGGVEIDKADGFLVLFDRPIDAVRAALAYHGALAADGPLAEARVQSRVGIHHAEVIVRANPPEDVARGAKPMEVEGIAKPTAARIMGLAAGRQTLLGRSAFDRARQESVGTDALPAETLWLAHGNYELKGVAEPIELFEVGRPGVAPLAPPRDRPKVRRVLASGEEELLGWRPAPGVAVPGRPGWLLEQKLGEGGFGEVWLARHGESETERVYKFCFDPERLRGLKREVTLVRLLKETLGDRDDIARVLGWQFDEPPFFIESEYTLGGDLTTWAAQQGGIRAVAMECRLELAAQVAVALAAAHSVGVLHKDIKPSNVLIETPADGTPRARLADFGIGLITDHARLREAGLTATGFTETHTMGGGYGFYSGTRLYMAPELAEGKAPSVQADVYALGVMLYQLVVGDLHHALSSDWRQEVEDDLLREDIELCVAGDPARRLANAGELAARLRSLGDRRAERERRLEEARAAAASHAALVRARRIRRLSVGALAGTAALALVVGGLWLRAERQRDQAELQRNIALQAIERNDGLMLFMLGDLKGRLEPIGRLDIMDAVLGKLSEQMEPVAGLDPTTNQLASQVGILRAIAEVQFQRGDYAGGEKSALAAIERAAELVAREPNETRHAGLLANSHISLARMVRSLLKPEVEAASLAEADRLLTGVHEREPERAQWLIDLSDVRRRRGDLARDAGDMAGARRLYGEALALAETLVAQDPRESGWQRNVGFGVRRLAELAALQGDYNEALQHSHRLAAQARDLVATDASNGWWKWELALALGRIGECHEKLGEIETATEFVREACGLHDELAAIDPENYPWRRSQVQSHGLLGMHAIRLGRPEEARRHLERALELAPGVPVITSPSNTWWQPYLQTLRDELAKLP